MKPTATFIADGKTDIYSIDDTSNLYCFVVKQLMKYTMSQDTKDLPMSIPLAIMLPKHARNKLAKYFLKEDLLVKYDISDCWTYVWNSVHREKNGWLFNGKAVSKSEYA